MEKGLTGKAGDLEEGASSSAVAPSILTSIPPHSSGSEAALLPSYFARSEGPDDASLVYYSTRIERMKAPQNEFDNWLEFDIESSRSHWTAVSEMSDMSDSDDEEVPNRVVFESMKEHPMWGAFFRRQPYDQLEIGAKIAEGGQAVIFEALGKRTFDKETRKRRLVLKVFKRGYSIVDLQKMWPPKMATVGFPSAVGLTDNVCWPEGVHLLDNGRLAFIFQRYSGDLRKLIDKKMMERTGCPPFSDFGMVFHLIKDIARGMCKLHDMDILHNDMKAANILVWHSNEHIYAVVADFESSLDVIGVGFWRAPEILLAIRNCCLRRETFTQQTDVYSFAMTCYEIITGRWPFEDSDYSDFDIVLRGERPTLPNDPPYSLLNNLVTRCWHQDPSQRPSFAEIIEELGSSHFSNVYNQRPYVQYPTAREEDDNWDVKMSPSKKSSKRDDIGYYPPNFDFLDQSKLLEKPNLYLSCHDRFVSAFEEHFHLRTIEECKVGVVFISKFVLTSEYHMVDLVRMVEEAKRRSDFKILPVMLDVSLAELDGPEMQDIQKQWDWMEVNFPGRIKARECADAYKYSRSCDCTVNTGLQDIELLNLVFDRIHGIIATEGNTKNLIDSTPPLSMKDTTIGSSERYKVRESSSSRLMTHQSMSVNDPEWSKGFGGGRKNKSVVDSVRYTKSTIWYSDVDNKRFFETLPPLPRTQYSLEDRKARRKARLDGTKACADGKKARSDGKMSCSDRMKLRSDRRKARSDRRKASSDRKMARSDHTKALSDGSTPKSRDCLQMGDAVQLQLDAQEDLQDQAEAQKAPLRETKSSSTTTFVKRDTDDDSKDDIVSSVDEIRDNLSNDVRKMNILEPKIDEDQLCEAGYDAFKNEIYEDIRKIDCIQELATHCVDMDTLRHDPDLIILSFCDESKESFEFYFKSREDMASIVGVGMEHAKVTLEGGEITIIEIMKEDWNQRWGSVKGNSCGNMKLLKMKRASPSNVHEGLTHLDVEISTRKPLLWELTKYFSLKECIATFATKEMYAKCANGGEASSSSLSNNRVQEVSSASWGLTIKKDIIGESPRDKNGGSISNESKERVMDCSKNSTTIVKLALLGGGRIVDSPEEAKRCKIVPNLEFTFCNEGEGSKMIHIEVGEISFNLAWDKDHNQLDWYHTEFSVIFGLLDENDGIDENVQKYGLLERQTLKHCNMSSGKYNSKISLAHVDQSGKESQTNFAVSATGGIPVIKGALSWGKAKKETSQASDTSLKEKSHESTRENTKGGLTVHEHVEEDYKIICNYWFPEYSTPRFKPIPSQHYAPQGVKFKGTWIPQESSPNFAHYTLIARRHLQEGGCEDKIYKQEYKTEIIVNHSMSHLDGKTYKIRVWKKRDGTELLTELGKETKWQSDLLIKLPDRDTL